MYPNIDSAYHYMVRPECETSYFVHGDAPNYSPANVTVYQSAIPDWIRPTAFQEPADPVNDTECGNPRQLLDHQIDIATNTHYTHNVYKIWNAFDLEDLSNQTVDFDPSFETLTLHECKVYRKGIWINKLDMNELRIIQREDDLENNIYSAQLLALLFLEDIREGDILDFSFSISVSSTHQFSVHRFLQNGYLWEKSYLRIVKPPNRSFQSNITPSDWGRYLTENKNEVIWEVNPCLPVPCESDQPPGYLSIAQFEMTEFSSWRDIASLMRPLCQLSDDFKYDSEVVQLVEQWKNSGATPEEQALFATRFVQDEIRYTGIETGIEAIQPSPPLATLKRRFGDCKGKSQLLRAFLDLLGIHSDLCLVSTKLCGSIKNHLPNLDLFNHIILKIDFSDQTSYVDATAVYEGGPLSQSRCPFGTGLVISEDTQDLTPIPLPLIHPEIDCQTTFEIGPNDPVKMSAIIHFYGPRANHQRRLLKSIGLQSMVDPLREYLEIQFGKITALTPVQIKDDRANNHLTIFAQLQLDQPWITSKKTGDQYLCFIPYFLKNYFSWKIDDQRTTALQLPSARVKESVTVKGGYLLTNTKTIGDKIFTFNSITSSRSKVDFELLTHLNELSPEDIDPYLEKRDNAYDEITVLIKRP